MPVEAAAAVDQVVRQFFNDFATGDRYWWWPVSVWVDPNQVIADDDEGHLYRVPFSTDDNGNASFGDPVRVVTQYRDMPADDSQPAVAAARPAVAFSAASAVRPRDRVRAANQTTEEEHMPVAPAAVLERLGLAEDATEEQVLAALDRENENDPGDEQDELDAAATTAEPVAATAATVTVSREVWEQTQSRLETLEQRDQQREQTEMSARRDRAVDDAVRAGRIAPSERDHYRRLLDVNEQETSGLLASLAQGRVPVDERSHGATVDATETDTHAQIMRAAHGVDVTAGKGN